MPTFKHSDARELYQNMTAEVQLVDQRPSDRLGELVMHVSEGCNLACTYCFADRGQYGKSSTKWMTAVQARTYVRSMASRYRNIESVKFFGGEPLINTVAIKAAIEEFRELVSSGNLESLPRFGAISNMTVVNKSVIKLINDNQIQLTGSIDGPPDINDKFRVYVNGRGSWEMIDKGIRRLREETGQPTALEVVYGPEHLNLGYSMVDIHKYLTETYGVENVIMHAMSAEPAVREEHDWKTYYNALRPLFYEYTQWLVDKFEEPSAARSVKHRLEGLHARRRGNAHCSLGIGTQTVTADGELFPCYTLIDHPDWRMSNDVTDPVHRDEEGRIQLRLIENRKSTNPTCSNCDLMVTCQACPGSNVSVNGSISTPDPGHCESAIGATEGFMDALIGLSKDPERWARFADTMQGVDDAEEHAADAGVRLVVETADV